MNEGVRCTDSTTVYIVSLILIVADVHSQGNAALSAAASDMRW